MRRITIRDVAHRAGVSRQTVSRVINNSDEVAEATRIVVQQAIDELEYYPNAHAVGLSRNRSDIVGLVVESATSRFFAQIIDGTAQALREEGRFMLLACADQHTQQSVIDSLQHSRRIDGMIIVLPVEASLEQAREITRARVPLVLVDLQYNLNTNYISVDNFHGAYKATEHLIMLGHHRIGTIGGRVDIPVGQTRLDGYRAALRDYGLPLDPALIVSGNFSSESGARGMIQLLALDDPPTAVFSSNDDMAFGAMFELRRRGLRVPEDMSIVGFDDIPETRYSWPPLTTVRQPLWEMGQLAGQYIARLLDEPDQPQLQLMMNTQLIVRSSTQAVDLLTKNR